MSGHSHWAKIRHKKVTQDARKGKLYSKLIRLITTAAAKGGPNIEFNPQLELAIEKAKDAGIPKDTIEKAINKSKEKENNALIETCLEGFGPEGVGIIVEAITDNKNRTISEIRKIFDTKGGSLASSNAVMWNFERKAYIKVSKENIKSEESLYEMLLSLEIDELDIQDFEDAYEITASPKALAQIAQALSNAGYKILSKDFIFKPKTSITIKDVNNARTLIELIETLEEHDDVQNVYSNADIPDQYLKSLAS